MTKHTFMDHLVQAGRWAWGGALVMVGCVAFPHRSPEQAVSAPPSSSPVAVVKTSPAHEFTVLVRPGLAEDAEAVLDREIAVGIAEALGKEARFVFESDEERMIFRLLSGEVDLIAAHLPITQEREDVVAFSLPYAHTDDGPAALAVRIENPELGWRVNEFLIAHALIGPRETVHTADLADIKTRGRLRVLTESGPDSFFIQRGEALGFEYELMKRFADRHRLSLEIVVPPTRSELVPWLLEGKGDVVAAGLTVRPELSDEVAFTRSYQNVQEVIVVREGANVDDLDDLAGRTVYVRAESSHLETLRELRHHEDDFEIAAVPEDVAAEEILSYVEDGTWDATVLDSHVLERERAAGRRLRSAIAVKAVRHAWAVRLGNPELWQALDEFLREEYRGLHFNVIRERYFEAVRERASRDDVYRSDVSGRISPYDDLIRARAEQFGLDWRLIAAQMFQESRFDASQVSFAGAAGLMQLMPRTAAELGAHERHDPEISIRAGTQYLRSLFDRFEPELPLATRIRFALASYNAGKGHVDDARKLAARLGWRDDRWYGGVQDALLLLQLPEYYRKARHGYCRARETVRYVRDIERRYRTYVEHVPVELALTSSPNTPGS